MYFFTTAAIVGQILFCLLLGGLLSDYWVKGIAFFFVATLLILVPTAHIAFRYKVRQQRWMGYGLLFSIIDRGLLPLMLAAAGLSAWA